MPEPPPWLVELPGQPERILQAPARAVASTLQQYFPVHAVRIRVSLALELSASGEFCLAESLRCIAGTVGIAAHRPVLVIGSPVFTGWVHVTSFLLLSSSCTVIGPLFHRPAITALLPNKTSHHFAFFLPLYGSPSWPDIALASDCLVHGCNGPIDAPSSVTISAAHSPV